MYEKIKSYWQSEKQNIIFCFMATFIIGLAAHAYVMLNNNMSHDWLNAFVATDIENITKIRVGRYIVPLYRAIFRNSIALPWLIGLISLLWYSVSSYLIARIFDIKSRIITVLISGIVVTNITVTAQFATYLHEADFNAFALLLAVAASYVWKMHTKIYHLIPGAIFLFISMGIYQSYVCVTIMLIICASVLDLFEEKSIKNVITRGFLGICLIITAFVVCIAVGKLICYIMDISQKSRVNALSIFSSGENIVKIVFEEILFFARELFHPAYSKELMLVIFTLTALIILSLVIYVFVKKRFEVQRISLILVLFACIPIGACAIFIIAYGIWVHDLMLYAVWLSWVMVIVLSCRLLIHIPKITYKRILNCTVCAFVAVIIWQNIIISNTVYIKKDIVAQSSFSTMTRVLDRIEQYPDYIKGQTPLAFIGVPNHGELNNPYDEIADFRDINSVLLADINEVFYSDTNNDIFNTYAAYFKYVLNSPVTICDSEKRRSKKYAYFPCRRISSYDRRCPCCKSWIDPSLQRRKVIHSDA